MSMSPSPSDPAPGVRRRDGRGYIDSFGEGRTCSAPDCVTKLSRYNEHDVCSTHDVDGRRRS
jgi:hypothetical protein